MSGLIFVATFLFDDTELGEHAERTVGYILIDELEVAAIQRVVGALERVYQELGNGKSDAEYCSSRHWPAVVEAAKKAYRLLRPRVSAEGDDLLPPMSANT